MLNWKNALRRSVLRDGSRQRVGFAWVFRSGPRAFLPCYNTSDIARWGLAIRSPRFNMSGAHAFAAPMGTLQVHVVFGKRDITFPHLNSNIPAKPAYIAIRHTSRLVQLGRTCDS